MRRGKVAVMLLAGSMLMGQNVWAQDTEAEISIVEADIQEEQELSDEDTDDFIESKATDSGKETASVEGQSSIEGIWKGNADTSWYKDGVEEFTLDSPGQLAGLAELVNNGNTFEGKYVRLNKDLYLNQEDARTEYSGKLEWTSIASLLSGLSFEGTFDGQGHILYNLYGSSLFGSIGEKGIVKAVRMNQGQIERASIANENHGWILFCENNGYVFNYGSNGRTGGICEENSNLIYGCGNTGTVMGYDAGGIAGLNTGGAASIDSCWNQGKIDGLRGPIGGIVSSNYGWVYDCYNSGTISNLESADQLGGIVGGYYRDSGSDAIYNCYHTGEIDADGVRWENWCDTICGGNEAVGKNVYCLSTEYNKHAEVIDLDKLKTAEAVTKLQGDKVITKWCEDRQNLNGGCIIPTAQQDMKNGVYKMLPDVWDAVTEVSIEREKGEYRLRPFSKAYYGGNELSAVLSSVSDILTVSPDGRITPVKRGTGIVRVTFEETEHGKETGFDVEVTITDKALAEKTAEIKKKLLSYSEETVKPTDKEALEKLNKEIEELLAVKDLTESEREDLNQSKALCGKLLAKIAETAEKDFLPGDVNEDKTVDIQDLRLILRYVCEKVKLTDRQIMIGDVEKDGKIDIHDLRKELRYVCGKLETLD